ncbi:MAG: P-loop NTPase [Oscillospiraceae bacterium]|nr:P-loop NTPase [Oscillospiraceae bacterium]
MSAVVAILSGKGGTGKSTAAAALACALSELGRSVVCLDADAELRNLDLCLGMGDQALLDCGDVIAGRCGLDKALTPSPDFPGLRLLAAPSEPLPGAAAALLPELRSRFDYCILDYPGGLGPFVGEAAALADRVLVVSTADPCSHRDGERTAQLLRREGAKDLRLIVNRVNPRLLKAGNATLDDTVDRVGLQLLGYVPDDMRVTLALTAGQPLLAADKRPKRGAAAAFRRIAKRLEGLRVPVL